MKTKLTLILLSAALALPCFAQITTVTHSAAAETGHAISTRKATLYSASGYNAGPAQYMQIHDAAAVPSDVVSGVAEVFKVDFLTLTGTDVTGKYIKTADGSGSVYFWFTTGSTTDPAPGGRGLPFTVSGTMTASGIATLLATSTDSAFTVTAASGAATFTNASTGARTDGTTNTGATLTTTTQGVTAIAASVPIMTLLVGGSSNFTFPIPSTGLELGNGISICNSSAFATKVSGTSNVFFTTIHQ